jgi:two-component system phosphate regulon response regulator PhoB
MSRTISVVEDEPDISELIRLNLSQAGFSVSTYDNGKTALEGLRQNPPDLVILDLMLPDLSGTDICREMRADANLREIPVIMLTAKTEEIDRIVGFEIGADDYVTKPFSPRELILRVKAILRRGRTDPEAQPRLHHRSLSLDLDRHRCQVEGAEVGLTAKEFNLLHALMERPGRVLTREQLLDRVWGSDVAVTLRTIDTHVKRLREKLGPAGELIDTIRGVGYRFED